MSAIAMPFPASGVRVAATALASASLFIWLAALPPCQVGLWFETEPVEIALYGVGALAALVLIFSSTKDAADALRHPLVLIPLALAALTLVMSLFVPFPARSWFGPPQTGEGGLWCLTLGLLVALFRIADADIVARVAVLSAVALAVARAVGIEINAFPDYLAFVGLAIGLACPGRPMLYLTPFLIAASGSKGALLFVPVCAVVGMLVCKRRWISALFAGAAPFAAMIAVAMLYQMPSGGSRLIMWAAAARAILREPGVWWHGFGWGGMNDMVQRHYAVIAHYDPHWEGLGQVWHSHNEFVEAWLSVGIAGPILMLALFVVAAHGTHDRLCAGCWAAYAGLSAIWMPIPETVPFLALALATVAGRAR